MDLAGRKFSLYLYRAGHGVLLLRSGITNQHATRIDILFQDVLWMSLPAWMNGLSIDEGHTNDVRAKVPPSLHEELELRRTYRLVSEGTASYVVCGAMRMAEDTGGYFEPSSLLREP